MKDAFHSIQISQQIAQLAAEYLARESNGTSLITVTRADVSPDGLHAVIYLSVFPDSAAESVFHFARRSRTDFRHYLTEHTRFGRIPSVDFVLDDGEKNRQRIDELTS